ncbi:hypothetical protein EB118_02120 [bacterium]|nr:hypothetical protein [bacterium]NDC93906.1 hypothetical protein [bacterium]NDD83260.1 hypothetical protein [bacterium]NDG28884.1 hypothetical protein [bacterium]
MSLTSANNDECYLQQKDTNNNGIFSYVTDVSRHEHKEHCANYNPPFIGYVPRGVSAGLSLEVENDLKGITRVYSKCTDKKYAPIDENLVQGLSKKIVNADPHNLREC